MPLRGFIVCTSLTCFIPSSAKILKLNAFLGLKNFNGAFVNEQHQVKGNTVSGWITSRTTCGVGKYKIYYCLSVKGVANWEDSGNHHLILMLSDDAVAAQIDVALSSVSAEAAEAAINNDSFEQFRRQSAADWNRNLSKIEVNGDEENSKLFYSLLYRTMQSPYVISEKDGTYRKAA